MIDLEAIKKRAIMVHSLTMWEVECDDAYQEACNKVHDEDIPALIEEVERLREVHKQQYNDLSKHIGLCNRYQAALEFYADEANWVNPAEVPDDARCYLNYHKCFDGWDKARKALGFTVQEINNPNTPIYPEYLPNGTLNQGQLTLNEGQLNAENKPIKSSFDAENNYG